MSGYYMIRKWNGLCGPDALTRYWTGSRWTCDARDGKRFASRDAAERHAREQVESRWTVDGPFGR